MRQLPGAATKSTACCLAGPQEVDHICMQSAISVSEDGHVSADNWAAARPRLDREVVIAQLGAKVPAAALHSQRLPLAAWHDSKGSMPSAIQCVH